MHGAATRGHTDALLMLIAYGVTGNERSNRGSVFLRQILLENVCCFMTDFFSPKKSSTPLHYTSSLSDNASTCKMLCALEGVDQNAVNDGETALDVAIGNNASNCVRALLDFNVDTSTARVEARTKVEIVQLLEEHRKRSVKKHFFR